jgi:hypothetical protein
MFGLTSKLPLPEEQRKWVDDGFERLMKMLGRQRLLDAELILPDDSFFPDPYDGSKASVIAMAEPIAGYMGVSREIFIVEIFAENEDAWRESVPIWHGESQDAAGLYLQKPEEGRRVVGVHAKGLRDPLALVATLAHELAHIILLGGNLLDPNADDMEPMTDLCTVFLGMGFFTASSAFQFKQWTSNRTQGWSTQRKGYLSEELWGYALARFAHERGEDKPDWAKQLPTNIRGYFKRSAAGLEKHTGRLE